MLVRKPWGCLCRKPARSESTPSNSHSRNIYRFANCSPDALATDPSSGLTLSSATFAKSGETAADRYFAAFCGQRAS
jgi:hypothetical protein